MLVGGWAKFRQIIDGEQELFNKALNGLRGVAYEPFAVSTQIVSGMNYKFLCNATTVTNPPRDFLAEVIIYQPQNGDPIINRITELD